MKRNILFIALAMAIAIVQSVNAQIKREPIPVSYTINNANTVNTSETTVASKSSKAYVPFYSESFEAGLGSWIQDAGDDSDWTRKSGSTSSSNTGPTGASDGTYYMYTEASGYSNMTFNLYSTFNFSTLVSPYFLFDYHMYGSSMGSLHIDIDDGSGWNLDVWNVSGQQNSSSADPYNVAEIDLSAYAGQTNVMIRFRGITGNSFRSDICIDNIIIDEVIITSEASAISATGFDLNGVVGDVNSTERGFVYSLTPTPTVSDFKVESSVSAGVLNESVSGLSPFTTYYVRAYAVTSLGAYYGEEITVRTQNEPITLFPYEEGFEGAFLPDYWSQYIVEGTHMWVSSASSHTGTTSAVFNWDDPNLNGWMVMPKLDLSNTANPRLEFYEYNGDPSYGKEHNVKVSFDYDGVSDPSGFTWDVLFSEIGTDSWIMRTLDLSAYKNEVYIAFQYNEWDGANWYIDDVTIYDATRIQDVSSTNVDGKYKQDDNIKVILEFQEAVTVSGTPQLLLETGFNNHFALYESGSGTSVITFSYNVQLGDYSLDLDYLSSNSLELNGGEILDASNRDIVLGLPDPGTEGSLGFNKDIVVDARATVNAVTSTTKNDTYVASDVINVSVYFTNDVTVSGSPRIELETGDTDRFANYSGGSGSKIISFSYTVQANDESADLDYTSEDALDLNGGSISDENGADVLTLFAPTGGTGSLGKNKNIVIDAVSPEIEITGTEENYTAETAFVATLTFSEVVEGFEEVDLLLTNGTVSNFTELTAGLVYKVNIDITAEGVFTLDVAGAVAQDLAGNDNIAASTFVLEADYTKPDVLISTTSSDPTTVSPIDILVTFNEEVFGFEKSDIALVNGKITNFSEDVPNTVWSFDVVPNGTGLVKVDVAAGVAADNAGNTNTIATQLTVDFTSTLPTVSMSTVETSPTNNSMFVLTVDFNEVVSGFTMGDITATNANLANFVEVTVGEQYTVEVSPIANGYVLLEIPADIAVNIDGNGNKAADNLSIKYDNVAPAVTLSFSDLEYTTTTPVSASITFSEQITGFAIGDLQASNATLQNLVTVVAGREYTVELVPSAEGQLSLDMDNGMVVDLAGNSNAGAELQTIIYDITKPTGLITTIESNPTNKTNLYFEVTFSEKVAAFDVSEFTVVNGTAHSLSDLSGSEHFMFYVVPASNGSVSVSLSADKITDMAGNTNAAVAAVSTSYDGVKPEYTLTSTVVSPTNTTSALVTITFSETISGFDKSGLYVSNGTLGTFTEITAGTKYSIAVAPKNNGTVSLDVKNEGLSDLAGNMLKDGSAFTFVYDKTQPQVVVSTNAASLTNASSIGFEIQFSETISGFVLADVTVENGSASNLVAITEGEKYTVSVVPAGQGLVTVSVGASTAVDAAGNNNLASNTVSVDYDAQVPVVSLEGNVGALTGKSTILLTLTANEYIEGLTKDDVTLGNASFLYLKAITSGISYELAVQPINKGTVTVQINAESVQDKAGNLNATAANFTTEYDNVAPVASLSTSEESPSNAAVMVVSVGFNESVSGLATDDFSVVNGTVSNLQTVTAGTSYTVDIVPVSDGAVSVSLKASAVRDLADNANIASNQIEVVFDLSSPGVSVSTNEVSPTLKDELIVRASFTENAVGFELADVLVVNGSATEIVTVTVNRAYDIKVVPGSDGAVEVSVKAGAASDVAGNSSTVSNTVSILYDTQAPAISNMAVTNVEIVTAAFSASLGEKGILYYSLLLSSANEPTPQEVINGAGAIKSGSGALEASAYLQVNLTKLSAATTYTIYAVARDVAGNLSALSSVEFTTKEDFTSVKDIHSGFAIYPNPTESKFYIEYTQEFEAPVSVKVYDVIGNLIYVNNAVHEKLEVDISDYPQGVYHIQIFRNDKIIPYKIIKQ